MSSYLEFVLQAVPASRKTDIWQVWNKAGVMLGEVKFSGAWRKFVFYVNGYMIFDSGCLREISDFCETKTAWWRAR